MPIPERIPIKLDEFHLDRIGRFDGGRKQFMAFVTGSLPELPLPPDWERHKRWYAVLHTFDDDGTHVGSEIWCGGTTASGEQQAILAARKKLTDLLRAIEPYQLQDILIRPFSITYEVRLFGLIPGYYQPDAVELLPMGLGFYEPWNGEYDT